MFKKFVFTFLWLLFAGNDFLFSQKNSSPEVYGSCYVPAAKNTLTKIKLERDDEISLKNYALKNIEELKIEGADLQMCFFKTSPGGKHFTFFQLFNSIPVYGAELKINLDDQKNIRSVMNGCIDLGAIDKNAVDEEVSKLNQKDFVRNFITKHYGAGVEYKNEINICFVAAGKAEAVQKITTVNKINGINELILLNGKNEIIYRADLKLYYSSTVPVDTVINCMIFNPDPLTTAHVVYGGNYVDNSDADNAVLTAQRISVINLPAKYNAGTFTLENNFVKIDDIELPTTAVVTSATPNFVFTRSQNGFEDVNAYFHITTMQQYVQSLGFTNLMNQQLIADTHGDFGQDNSYFSKTGAQPYLSFGEGGVDDAEDADVITHEYGHALSWSANNNNFTTSDRSALDEAFGDYQAATYSRGLDPYNWGDVFSWDGHNTFWPGRSVATTKVYPADLVGEIHTDGEIWTSAMMEIWTSLGKTVTDKLQYEALYNYSSNMTMPDAALLVFQADTLQNGGANYFAICTAFSNHGLYNGTCISGISKVNGTSGDIKILNSQNFTNGNGDITLLFSENKKRIDVEIFDVTGRKMNSFSLENSNKIAVSPEELLQGIYFIAIKTESGNYSVKVLRTE